MNVLALLLAGLLMVVPGAGAAMAVFGPGTIALPTRLALVFSLGYVATGGVAFVLTIGRVLSPTSFFALLIVVTAVLWIIALRRGSLADHGRALLAEVRADPWPVLGGLVVVVGVAAVAFGFSPLLNFSPSTSWRYWVDGREIAAAGRVPAASLQYGTLLPPTVSKVFLNAFDAALTYTVGTDPLRSLGPLKWLSAVGRVA